MQSAHPACPLTLERGLDSPPTAELRTNGDSDADQMPSPRAGPLGGTGKARPRSGARRSDYAGPPVRRQVPVIVSLLRESRAGERRVLLLSDDAARLCGICDLQVETGAGHGLGIPDGDY